eukprot:9823874-Alexandrium_andersonii.AAC.1
MSASLVGSEMCIRDRAQGVLPLLLLDLGREVAPLVVAQDAAGPMSSGPCRTGAYCLGAAVPPLAE